MDEETSPGGYWKQSLYLLQEKAPKPKGVYTQRTATNQPPYYGHEFHEHIDRNEAEKLLLEAGEGAYLIRTSKTASHAFTLCFLFDGSVRNYKLYYDGAHYVGEKRLETFIF